MLKTSGMYRRSRRLCGQGRRRHEEGIVDIMRESPLTEARRGAEPEVKLSKVKLEALAVRCELSHSMTEARLEYSTVTVTATALAAEALADRSATAEAAEHVRSESRAAQASRALV